MKKLVDLFFKVVPCDELEKMVEDVRQSSETKSPILCCHANEVPLKCPCKQDCYCKEHTCKYI